MSSLRPNPHPRREPSFPGVSTAQLGMYIGLASLTMIFGASLVAYFVTRAQSQVWRTVTLPHLPLGLFASTLLLVGVSAALYVARRRLDKNDLPRFRTTLSVALALGGGFLLAQLQNWRGIAQSSLAAPVKTLFEFTFYFLTGLHALHVLGGLLALAFVRSRSAHYSSSNSEGPHLVRQYWDFLLVVWVVLLGALWIGN